MKRELPLNRTPLQILIAPEIRADLEILAKQQGRTIPELVREGIIYVLTKYAIRGRRSAERDASSRTG